MTGVIVAFPRKEAIGKIKSILQKNGYIDQQDFTVTIVID